MQEGVFKLLNDAGISLRIGSRGYRPTLSLDGFETKILKPQNIVEMLHLGSRDVGFAGADWVREMGANLVELLDTGLDPVRIVAAAPTELLKQGKLPKVHLRVASEYRVLTTQWIQTEGIDATFIRSYGATEVFPPEDADIIVDNTATGSTLVANGLEIVGELMKSSTRLYANPTAYADPVKRQRIDDLALLLRSVVDARLRVMVDINSSEANLSAVEGVLQPFCMQGPTVAQVVDHTGTVRGYALRAAVLRKRLPELILKVKQAGGSDIVVSALSQIIP